MMDFRDVLVLLGVSEQHDKYGSFRLNDRKCRYLPDHGRVDVGEMDSTFDRWANSVDFSFDVHRPAGHRQFMRWATEKF